MEDEGRRRSSMFEELWSRKDDGGWKEEDERERERVEGS